jgi:hypothetical protein
MKTRLVCLGIVTAVLTTATNAYAANTAVVTSGNGTVTRVHDDKVVGSWFKFTAGPVPGTVFFVNATGPGDIALDVDYDRITDNFGGNFLSGGYEITNNSGVDWIGVDMYISTLWFDPFPLTQPALVVGGWQDAGGGVLESVAEDVSVVDFALPTPTHDSYRVSHPIPSGSTLSLISAMYQLPTPPGSVTVTISPRLVPEPSTLGLCACAGLALAVQRAAARRKHRRPV